MQDLERARDGVRDETTVEARSVAAYAAEGIGTLLLVFFICAILSVANAGALQLDLAGLGLLHALTLGVLVYTLAASSGRAFNPAVTVAQLAIGQIRPRDAAAYVVFQLLGGVLAALLVMLLFHDAGAAANYGATAIDPKVIDGGSPWLGPDRRGGGHVHADVGRHGASPSTRAARSTSRGS